MRPLRITRILAIALMLVIGWVEPASADQLREPLDVRLAVSSTIVDSHETGQGKWLQFRHAVGNGVGFGTIGTRTYFVTSEVDVMGKVNATLTDGRKTAVGTSTFAPTGFGDVLACDFTMQYRNVEADELFGLAEVGFVHLWCDNGTKMTAEMYGAYEIDPASGLPVYFMNFTGEAKS